MLLVQSEKIEVDEKYGSIRPLEILLLIKWV